MLEPANAALKQDLTKVEHLLNPPKKPIEVEMLTESKLASSESTASRPSFSRPDRMEQDLEEAKEENKVDQTVSQLLNPEQKRRPVVEEPLIKAVQTLRVSEKKPEVKKELKAESLKPVAEKKEEKKAVKPVVESALAKEIPKPSSKTVVDSSLPKTIAVPSASSVDAYPVPKTAFEFERDYRSLSKNTEALYLYLKRIPPSTLPTILRATFDANYLIRFFEIARDFYLKYGFICFL